MPINVVYVDDEPMLLENFVDCFSSDQVVIRTFSNPTEALKEINANPPDILFIDYRLPGITGDEIALKLDQKIPKYLITGDLTVKSKYNFIKIFMKPYDENEVLQIIQAVAKKF